jgi:hypothetical protein
MANDNSRQANLDSDRDPRQKPPKMYVEGDSDDQDPAMQQGGSQLGASEQSRKEGLRQNQQGQSGQVGRDEQPAKQQRREAQIEPGQQHKESGRK